MSEQVSTAAPPPRGFRIEDHLGSILVAVPLFNLLLAGLHLVGYALGFGGGLLRIVRPPDVLLFSVQNLLLLLVVNVLTPIFAMIVGLVIARVDSVARERRLNEIKRLQTAQQESETSPEVAKALSHAIAHDRRIHGINHFTDSIVPWFIPLNALVVFCILYLKIGHILATSVVLLIIGSLLPIAARPPRWLIDLGRAWFLGGWILIVVPGGIFAQGYDQGLIQRNTQYSAVEPNVRCGTSAIIRTLTVGYLIVLPNNDKAIMDDDCKIRLTFPRTAEPNPPIERLGAWWSSLTKPAPVPKPTVRSSTAPAAGAGLRPAPH